MINVSSSISFPLLYKESFLVLQLANMLPPSFKIDANCLMKFEVISLAFRCVIPQQTTQSTFSPPNISFKFKTSPL